MRKFSCVLLAVALLVGCSTPSLDYKRPVRWAYAPDLLVKADTFETEAFSRLNGDGLLQYRWREPYTTNLVNRQRSNTLTDGVAWQGYMIAALAFRAATQYKKNPAAYDPAPVSARLNELLPFFARSYAITGKPGLLCRSTAPNYSALTLQSHMSAGSTDFQWSPFSFGGGTEWCLDRPNKDHVNMAGAGLGIALALDRMHPEFGFTTPGLFTAATRTTMLDALRPLVQRLVNDGYLIRDHTGERTTHPDLRPNMFGIIPEGMNRVSTLQLLAGVASNESASPLQATYDQALEDWGTGYAWGMKLTGWWTMRVGHSHRRMNPGHSNPQALAMAACSFLLNETSDLESVREVKEALKGWWRFMKYEPNGVYWPIMLHFNKTQFSPDERVKRMRMVIDELQSFPAHKQVFEQTEKVIRGKVQPIHNRPVDSNYWKANPYNRASGNRVPTERHLAGMDFLLSYWMGRYFDFIEATKSGL